MTLHRFMLFYANNCETYVTFYAHTYNGNTDPLIVACCEVQGKRVNLILDTAFAHPLPFV